MNRRQFSKSLAASALLSSFTKTAFSQETSAMTAPTAFEIAIPEAQLADLKYRLQHTRWPDEPADAGWAMGTNLDYMKRLTDYWINDYDWRKAEASLNALANFKVSVDGVDLHFVHQPFHAGQPEAEPSGCRVAVLEGLLHARNTGTLVASDHREPAVDRVLNRLQNDLAAPGIEQDVARQFRDRGGDQRGGAGAEFHLQDDCPCPLTRRDDVSVELDREPSLFRSRKVFHHDRPGAIAALR